MQTMTEKKIKKIWVAMSTPFQANFFAPLIKELEGEFEFVVTAREHDGIFSILRAKGIDYISVGHHGGRELDSKLEAYAKTIQGMLPIVQREKPDLLLTERWPEAVRVAFGLNIPSWTIFYDERETHVNQMVFPLASKVFAPRFYSLDEMYKHGVTDPEKIVWFNGFHTCYLKGETTQPANPFDKMGLKGPVVFVRPEPEFASFFGNHKPILEKSVEILSQSGMANIAVLPRTELQKTRYLQMKNVTVLQQSSMFDSPVAHADVTVGAAETMLMEAFVLGRPSVSAIYWQESKPVQELHRYIAHSTDPAMIASYTEELLAEPARKSFAKKASLLVKSMDNPVRLMIEEIRRINEDEKEKAWSGLGRRSRMEILLDIIQAASLRPLRPTQIMRNANISYNELKKILTSLESSKLLLCEETFNGRLYQTTEEGLHILEDYRGLRQRLFEESS